MSRVSLLPEGEQQQLGRYQLVGQIASGGMASVNLARSAGVGGFQRFFAIKRLHPHLAEEPEFVEMFLDEARLAASIHHRNVVPILEIGTSTAGYYLVMEYIEGATLARLMTQAAVLKNPVPRPVLLRIVVDTLSGLGAAHDQCGPDGAPLGVVHRDCSPQNILVGLDGCTRITDFGIARATSRLHTTRDGAMKGKLAYMAPEQTQGESFDLRADLFSVAVVLFELLSGLRLFKAKTEAQTLRRLLHDRIPRLSDVMESIHPALEQVCVKGLERDPDARYQSAEEMADAVESAAREASEQPQALATERAVEALMKERYGQDVDDQREALRNWLQATPTMVGPRGQATKRGWLGPSVSQEMGDAPLSDDAWVSSSGERRGVSSGPSAPSTPHTDRAWPNPPVRGQLPSGEETQVYEPTSTAGLSGPSSATPAAMAPSTQRSEELPAAGGWLRWLLAAGVAAVMAVVGLWAMGDPADDGLSSARPQEPETRSGAAASATSMADAAASDGAAAPSSAASASAASTESSGAPPSSAPSTPTARPTTPRVVSSTRPQPATKVDPPATAEPPATVAPPPKPPVDDEDLSNPYR